MAAQWCISAWHRVFIVAQNLANQSAQRASSGSRALVRGIPRSPTIQRVNRVRDDLTSLVDETGSNAGPFRGGGRSPAPVRMPRSCCGALDLREAVAGPRINRCRSHLNSNTRNDIRAGTRQQALTWLGQPVAGREQISRAVFLAWILAAIAEHRRVLARRSTSCDMPSRRSWYLRDRIRAALSANVAAADHDPNQDAGDEPHCTNIAQMITMIAQQSTDIFSLRKSMPRFHYPVVQGIAPR